MIYDLHETNGRLEDTKDEEMLQLRQFVRTKYARYEIEGASRALH
jgi:hypothetical protein